MTNPSIKDMVDCIVPQMMANDIIGGEPKPIDMSRIISMIRETVPEIVAREILSVQPMDPDLGRQLMEGGMSEAQLIAEGYTPVSNHKLLWTKPA